MTEKPSFEDYLERVVEGLGFPDDPQNAERLYEFNMRAALQSVNSGPVMSGILAQLRELAREYSGGRPELLFFPAGDINDISLRHKPFRSTINKVYRHDIVYNRAFPDEPRDGFIKPSEIYEKIDDILRTRLVCKYMDGPKFVCEGLKTYCNAQDIVSHFRELSTDAGYYAWHFYFRAPAELMGDGKVELRDVWVEIQLTTQLAEVIGTLTHGLYEARRLEGRRNEPKDWKWDASSQQFRSTFLGHGLHLLEGLIQTFKDEVLAADAAQVPRQPQEDARPDPVSSRRPSNKNDESQQC